MPKRVNISIDEKTFSLLEEWCEQIGHTVTSLCAWLVKRSLKSAIDKGEFKPTQSSNVDSLAIAYIQALSNSGTMNVLDLQKLASDLNVPSDRLAEILKQSKGEVRNGNAH